MKQSGVYKITSPSNKIYIGQSIDLQKRLNDYQKYNKTGTQIRLKASFDKYGVENHIFEIIEECPIELLNQKERYWQEYYDVLGENGLNCKLTSLKDKSGKLRQEIKDKISQSLKGQKRTEEQKQKMSNSQKGKKQSKETIEKRIDKIKKLNKDENHRRKFGKSLRKKIYQYDNKGIFIKEWESLRTASRELNIQSSQISRSTKRGSNNNSAGGFLWSYEKLPCIDGKIGQNKIKVKQYNLDNDLISEWESVTLAAKETNTSKASIIRCCKGRQKTANGFIWRY